MSRSQQQRELSQPAKGKAARRFPCTRVPPTRHRTAGAPVYTHLRGDAPVARCISRRGAPSCGMNWCTLRGRPPRSVYLFHGAALINFLFVCDVPPVGRPALAVFYVYWPALQARAHVAAGVFFWTGCVKMVFPIRFGKFICCAPVNGKMIRFASHFTVGEIILWRALARSNCFPLQ